MAVKCWFIAYFDSDPKKILAGSPELDREKTINLVQRLRPDEEWIAAEDGDLWNICPSKKFLTAAVFDGLAIIAHEDLANDHPSKLDPKWIYPTLGSTIYTHATYSAVDWTAFSLWRDAELVRSLSLSSDPVIDENIGDPLSFEQPFWNGDHPLYEDQSADSDDESEYPHPFHPIELGDASLLHHLGFQFEEGSNEQKFDLDDIPMMIFHKKSKPLWKFW